PIMYMTIILNNLFSPITSLSPLTKLPISPVSFITPANPFADKITTPINNIILITSTIFYSNSVHLYARQMKNNRIQANASNIIGSVNICTKNVAILDIMVTMRTYGLISISLISLIPLCSEYFLGFLQ